MPRLELFPFRYRESFMGKWVKARYRSERHEIAARYAEWEVVRPPEIREVGLDAHYFTPWKVVPQAELMGRRELPPEMQPHLAEPPRIDEREARLATISSQVRHILRAAKTICTNARRRTPAS